MGAPSDADLLLLAAQIDALEGRAQETSEAVVLLVGRLREGAATEEQVHQAEDAAADVAEELAILYRRSAKHADRLALLLGDVDGGTRERAEDVDALGGWWGGLFGKVRSALA